MGRLQGYFGLQDARGMRGILSRGHARYSGPGKAPKTGNIFDVQRAAKNRIKNTKKFQDMRRIR